MLFCACGKFLEVDRPIDRQTAEQVFQSDETAEAATVGIYGRAVRYGRSYLTGITTQVTSIVADEMLPRNFSADYHFPYVSNDLTADLSYMSTLWQYPYELIYHCNSVIDKLAQSQNVSENLKKRLMAEVKFFRAFHYFYLINFYGEVPLATKPDYRVNGSLPKSNAADVYALILNDLEEAYANLSDEYFATEKVRANKWAACALLARTHLYLEHWEEAAAYAQALINSQDYRLVDIDSIVLNSNDEAIFQISMGNNSGINVYIGYIFQYLSSTTNQPDYHVRQGLLDAFSPEDARKTWLWEQTATDGVVYHLAYKYKVGWEGVDDKLKEHLTLFRLGEQYLILAEAAAHQGKLDEAIVALDSIRNRAGIPLVNDMNIAITEESLLDLVMEERQRELCFEFGHRWLDLNRTGRAAEVLGNIPEKNWQPTDRYFPIPQSEILLNPFLKQNPGYE